MKTKENPRDPNQGPGSRRGFLQVDLELTQSTGDDWKNPDQPTENETIEMTVEYSPDKFETEVLGSPMPVLVDFYSDN